MTTIPLFRRGFTRLQPGFIRLALLAGLLALVPPAPVAAAAAPPSIDGVPASVSGVVPGQQDESIPGHQAMPLLRRGKQTSPHGTASPLLAPSAVPGARVIFAVVEAPVADPDLRHAGRTRSRHRGRAPPSDGSLLGVDRLCGLHREGDLQLAPASSRAGGAPFRFYRSGSRRSVPTAGHGEGRAP